MTAQKEPREPIRAKLASVTRDGTRLRYKVAVKFPQHIGLPVRAFFMEIEGVTAPEQVETLDFVVLSLLFCAMRYRTDLFVEGRLSTELLTNLEEFQRAWAMWWPQRYAPVRIGCSEEVSPASSDDRRAVIALSGGVDSAFALLSQTSKPAARDQCKLVSGVMVHGFDIALEDAAGFSVARNRVAAMAERHELPLAVVRTDWRARICEHWADEHGIALAACLSLFAPMAGIGIIGGDEDYRNPALPWGSNYVTNPLLRGDAFRILTVGSGFGRTAKVAQIAKSPGLAESLRVCWQGPEAGRNCGACEKCVRTKLNFMAAGAAIPDTLGAPPTVPEILRLQAPTPVQIAFLRDIETAARAQDLAWPIIAALTATRVKNQLLLPLRGWRKWVRRQLRRVFPR